VHYTPTYTSWINLVECWFAVRTNRRLRRGSFTSTRQLEAAVTAYLNASNTTPTHSDGPRPPMTSSIPSRDSAC
jgi:transposase